MSTTLTIADGPKMLREALCVAEHAVNRNVEPQNQHGAPQILAALIAECDRHRPLGPDGKHGDRHTDTCGCDDAPLDPSKVKAGDTVTLTKGETSVRGPVTGISYAGGGEWDFRVGEEPYRRAGRIGLWTITAHQPAPEPEPEWKPGTTGWAVVSDGDDVFSMRVMRVEWDGIFGFATESGRIIADEAAQWSVSDFVPDKPRPLPTRDELAEAITRGTASDFSGFNSVSGPAAADRVLDLLDGAR